MLYEPAQQAQGSAGTIRAWASLLGQRYDFLGDSWTATRADVERWMAQEAPGANHRCTVLSHLHRFNR